MCYNSIRKIKDPKLGCYYRAAFMDKESTLYTLYTNIELELNVWMKAKTLTPKNCRGIYPRHRHTYMPYFKGFGVYCDYGGALSYLRGEGYNETNKSGRILKVKAAGNPREATLDEYRDYTPCLIFSSIKIIKIMN